MSVLAGDERHNLLTEGAGSGLLPPQQVPPQPRPIPPRTLPEPTPPAKPTVFKPTGPPIPALTSVGYWGSIHDFNAAVQAAHDGYVAANGVRPDPNTLLSTALKTPVTAGRRDQGPEQLSKLPPIGKEDNSALLGKLKAITQGPYEAGENQQRRSDFNDFMHQNSDVLQGMLNDPKTKAKTLATINAAEDSLDFHGVNGPGLSFVGALKDVTARPASFAARSALALSQDFFSMGGTSMSDGKTPKVSKFEANREQATTFPHLTKVAPALAQVVKGLVYSPAGLAVTIESVSQDLYDAALYERTNGRKGSLGFNRTRKMAEGFGYSLWQDLNDPSGRAGYALLDVFGLMSLGVGGAARFGRAAEAFSEADAGSKLGAAVSAARRPHPLRTVEYNKGGFTENISLPSSPFAALIARKIPIIGTDAQVAQLLDPMHDSMSWLREAKIGDEAYGRGDLSDRMANALESVNPLSPEARMGRAGSISRQTDAKVLSANLRQVEDVAGWSVRKSWLDSIVPDSWFEGLTRGEDKALQIAALDYKGDLGAKISAWETTHQFLMESGIGDREAHLQQLAELHLARKSVENPTARFTHALDVLRDTSTKAEQLRIAWGMPEQAAVTGLLKPGLFVQYANEAAGLMSELKDAFAGVRPPEMPEGVKEMELRLHNLKSFMGNLDVRYIPEGYTVPEFKPSETLDRKMKDLAKKQNTLEKTQAAEHEWMNAQRAKIAAATKGKGREFALDSKYRETIVSLSEVVDSLKKEVATRTAREQKVHAGRHPAEGLPEGYYAKIGGTFVPVNRQSEDSFYVPTLLRGGRTPTVQRGNVRLPGSIYGIGPAAAPIWNDYQMSGRALMDGDFRTDTPHLVGQSYAATARAIPRFELFNKAWAAAREVDENSPLGPHDVYIRDVSEISPEIRKAFQSLREGHITQEETDGIPADLMEHLFPRNPKPGEHVRAIDQRILGDAFFGAKDRAIAQSEPAVRLVMSPVNNTLRPLILYMSPKYALNIIGNGGMMVFDQGFIRSYQNLALAFQMKDWALEDDYTVFLNGMGAGKASSYMSGEVGTKLGSLSQGLADFWSKASDQNFRLASGLFYAKKVISATPDKFAGETFAEKFHDLLSNPDHEVARDDVMKRGNDALVAFDRMSPIEKAWLRHVIFVYPWQRGALLWSFRAIFEHPAKSALLATLGQEEYTDDKWLKAAPEWVRTTGYVPYHWNGDSVMVQNMASVNTYTTMSDVLQTAKGLIEGDPYARASDLFGPAGQLLSHAATGVDSYGNPYKGSQLLGAIEDTMNMLPAVSSYKRATKGAGKAVRDYDVTSRTGLSSVLTSAAKTVALSPGWLGGWGNWLAGGFSPRELNLTAVAARYWVAAPPKERHQHEVDLIMRQIALQAFFLKTGKMPDDKVVSGMLLAPLNSIQIKGQVPEDVRQAVLDAGQISYQAQIESKNLGHGLTDKEQLLLSLKYYREAGRLPKDEYGGLVKRANRLDNSPDIKAMKAQVAVNYGHGKALYEWDRRVRLQASFTNADTGVANVNQRTSVLFAAGLASKPTYSLSEDERGQYGHKYVEYLTARDALKTRLSADKTLTGTQRSLKMTEFDSQHDVPVKIGTHTLPSLAALGSGANWDGPSTDTAASSKRLSLLATKNWYHLNSAEKTIFGQKTDPNVSEGWDHYWAALKQYRDGGGSVDAGIRKQAAQYVTRNYAKGFMKDWTYANSTPKIERFLQSKVYKSIPDREAFDGIASAAKVAAKAMADGTSTITQTRHDWKAYVTKTLMPWIEQNHPQLYAWLQPLGPSFLTSMINTG